MSYAKKLASGNATAALLDVYNSLKKSSTPATKAVTHDGDSGDDKPQTEERNETAKEKDPSAADTQPRTGAVRESGSVSSPEKSKSSDLNVARKNTKSCLPSLPKKGRSEAEISDGNLSELNFSFPWTHATHVRFLFAIFDFAIKKASPKKLMKLMGYMPDSLTSEHVKSHLQKFRMHYKKTRSAEAKILSDMLKKEAKDPKKYLLSEEERKKVLTMYPLHKKAMHYHRANVSQSMLPKKRLKRKRNALSEPDELSNTIKSAEKIGKKTKVQKDVLSNTVDAATPDTSAFSRLQGSGSEVINSKIFKLKSEMDSLMKKHQKYLKQQNQQVLRYSYMSNVQSAIPNQFNTIDANDTTSGINGEGFSSVQDALAALNNLGDKAAAGDATTDKNYTHQ